MIEVIVMVILVVGLVVIGYKIGWDACMEHWQREIDNKMRRSVDSQWYEAEVKDAIVDGLMKDMKFTPVKKKV